MKIALALLVVCVVATHALPEPQAEGETVPEPEVAPIVMEPEVLAQFTAKMDELVNMDGATAMRLKDMKTDMDMSMMMTKMCMFNYIMEKCGCTDPMECPIMKGMMKCHKFEMKSRLLSKMVPKDNIYSNPFPPMDKAKFDKIAANCGNFLPPPKFMIKMMLEEDEKWHSCYSCLAVQGYEKEFNTCIVPAFQDFLLIKDAKMPFK